MQAQLIPFQFQAFTLRVEVDEHGHPWFCAKDVCDILGYTNSAKTVKDHCKPGGGNESLPPSNGRRRSVPDLH